MKTTTSTDSSRIFKSDQRSSISTAAYNTFSSFSRHAQQNGDPAYGNLVFFDDVFLKPGQAHSFSSDKTCQSVLIPLVGALSYSNKKNTEQYLAAEEILFLNGMANEAYTIKNPYADNSINYLHIALKKDMPVIKPPLSYPIGFSRNNVLESLMLDRTMRGSFAHAGIYQGRTKDKYILKNSSGGAFVYVINGAFEVEDRLMEHRDGLALWNVSEIEFESLSEHAILLILEYQCLASNQII